MRNAACIGFALLIVLASSARGDIQVSVEQTTVAVGRLFYITVDLSGRKIGDPQIPDADGLTITKDPVGQSSGTYMSINGMNMTTLNTRQLVYQAQATRAGKLTAPPIKAVIDGKEVASPPISLNAIETPLSQQPGLPPPMPAPPPSQPQPPPGPGGRGLNAKPTWSDVVFVDSDVNKREAYQGEPIQLTLSLWRLRYPNLVVGNYRGQDVQYPASEGFYAVTLKPAGTQKERNGLTYDVTQFRRILYPTATGDLQIGPWHWVGGAQYGLDGQNFKLDTPPIEIKVKPLPAQPPEFSGAVGGEFTIKAQLTRSQVVQGAPIQLTVRVSGRGSPDAIGAPQMPKIDNAYVSDPEKNSRTDADAGINEKTFTYAITPLEAGDLPIPEIAFCYFDPGAGSFKVIKSNSFTVRVLPSGESPSRIVIPTDIAANPGKVKVLGEDIASIVAEPGRLRAHRSSRAATPVAVTAPVLAYCGFALLMRRKRRFERDTGYARDYFARSKGHKRLQNVKTAAEPSEELYRALIGYVADKFNAPEAGLTSADAQQLFVSRDIDPDLAEQFSKNLRACERARYASARLTSNEIDALVQAAAEAMDHLDDLLRRGRGKGRDA